MDEVLEIRDYLSQHESGIDPRNEAQVSMGILIQAYKAVDGDLEILGIIADSAYGIASELSYPFNGRVSNRVRRARFTIGLSTALQGYLDHPFAFFDKER